MNRSSTERPSISRRLLRRLVFEWILILLTALSLIWLLSVTRPVLLANDYAYDRVLSSHERVADSDIVVVAIDEEGTLTRREGEDLEEWYRIKIAGKA